MSLATLETLSQDFYELQKRVNEQIGMGPTTSLGASQPTPLDPHPIVITPPKPPQDQQLRNGDESYSVNGYLDTVAAPGTDKVKEAAWWYSNDSVVAAQVLDFKTAETDSNNKTLKSSDHSTWNPVYCDWDSTGGFARMTGKKSLDAPFPTSPVYPGRTEYAGAIIALLNEKIRITADTHIGAFLYDNTPTSEDIMKAANAFHLEGAVRGTPLATTQRKYKVFAKTDKGISFLSDELDLASAPSDADFASGAADVGLSWESIGGILQYQVYRHDITAGKYRLLITISSGTNSYGDNNHIEAGHDNEGAYPVATNDRVICYAATSDGELSNLPVNGVALKWADAFWNIQVPAPLAANGAGHQVFRLQLDKAMDREFAGVTAANGNADITTAVDEFVSLDTGRTVKLTSADGLHTLTTTATYDTTKKLTLAAAPTWSDANTTIYVVGGGDHGLLIDMIHVGYIKDAKYGAYPDDLNRTLPPAAAPNSSGQGGVGGGGSGGGDPGEGGIGKCIVLDCPVWFYEGNRPVARAFSAVSRGFALFSANVVPNQILDVQLGETDNLHIVRFECGICVPCSPRQAFISSRWDRKGTPAEKLKKGDYSLVVIDGVLKAGRIAEVVATGKSAKVGYYTLSPGHIFCAGFVHRSLWQRLRRWFSGETGPTAALVHNAKQQIQ